MKIKNKIKKVGVNLDEGLEKNYSLKGFWKKQDSWRRNRTACKRRERKRKISGSTERFVVEFLRASWFFLRADKISLYDFWFSHKQGGKFPAWRMNRNDFYVVGRIKKCRLHTSPEWSWKQEKKSKKKVQKAWFHKKNTNYTNQHKLNPN